MYYNCFVGVFIASNGGFMKRYFVFLGFIFSLFQVKTQDINFRWGFYSFDESKGTPYLLDISEDLKMKKSDYIRLYFEISSGTYIYLYYLDSKKDLYLLYPENFDVFKNEETSKKVFLPSEEDWFSFDDNTEAGYEEFYLIASNKHLVELEKLTSLYLKETERKKHDEEKLENTKKNIINEMMRLKRINSDKVVIAEKPISTAGVTKGINNKSKKGSIIEVTSKGFYAKTIKLEY